MSACAASWTTSPTNTWTHSIEPERLLMFDVKEGWEPLCKFLEVPVPDVPFPRVNDAEQVANYIDAKVKAVSLQDSSLLIGTVLTRACAQGKRRWLYVAAGSGAVLALGAAVVWVM